MTSVRYRKIAADGLWHNNPGLVQLLAVSPLLAKSTSVVNALALGFATLTVLTVSGLFASLLRHRTSKVLKVPVLLMVIAALTTCVELIMQAYAFKLYQALGIFVPLLAVNCLLLARPESFAHNNPPLAAIFDGLMNGAGFLLLFVAMGSIREILGTGALFANMEQLLPFAADWKVQVFSTDTPFLLALLPPGAFLVLGFLIALKNVIDKHMTPSQPMAEPVIVGGKRVRVTGKIS